MSVGLKTWDGLELPVRVQLTQMHRQLDGQLGNIVRFVNPKPGFEFLGKRAIVRLDRLVNEQQEYPVRPNQVRLYREKRRRSKAA